MKLSNAKEIIMHHEAEWNRMMNEENDRQSLLKYGMMMLVVAYALKFVLALLFSGMMSMALHFSPMYWVTSVIIEFVLAIAALYFVPQILAAIAPSFGGQNNGMNALKLYVFTSTPAWIGMSIGSIPIIGWLVAIIGAVYAIILFWNHFEAAMSIPADKKIGYIVVSIIVLAVIQFVISAIAGAIALMVSPYSVLHTGMY